MSIEAIRVPQSLALVLNRAGDKSGVDFDYLVQTAMRESSLNPHARANSSSAVGLFQFLEGTWLEVMKLEGGRLGYGEYARAIEQDSDGSYVIRNKALRDEVLALRENPQISADLAAAYTKRNGEYLSNRFGRNPSPGELYIAHFLGAAGAERMFRAGLENPEQIAANLFPSQAQANRAIFYGRSGPRTIRQVYQALVATHGQTGQVSQSGVENRPANSQNPGGPVYLQPAQVSFSSMYSEPGAVQARPRQVVVDPGGALFVQLYGK